ncbi:transcription antitermination factor NusB [Virgibacillus soli]|uniref:transcription antitermination factor NusB n=1 Tax=Paracerasibacillus soli TaxID=480284 RepID=UPI0035E62437
MNRHKAREKAFQILFPLDINELEVKDEINNQEDAELVSSEFLQELVKGVIQNKQAIDQYISESLKNWTIDRIATVEKTILRIATYEIIFREDIPVGVSINEAVELAKVFGDEKSSKFINGVLSNIIKDK